MDTIVNFIFSWHTYFCCMPFWFCLFLLYEKLTSKVVTYSDVPIALFFAVINPLINFLILLAIPVGIIMGIAYWINEGWWQKVKNKKLF